MALAIAALMSVVALAIDVGMLLTARAEAQRAADAAALAGAGSLIVEPGNADRAKDEAVRIGDQNFVFNEPAGLLREDVAVDVAQGRVTATVFRTADRGSALATWFARVFGVDFVDVSARAVAQVGSTNAAVCLKPWIAPDAWDDLDGDGEFDDTEYYESGVTGYGSDWRNGEPAFNGIDPDGTTYHKDRGRPLVLKPGNPQEANQPGWFFPWDIPQADGSPSVGGARYRWNIVNCNPSVVRLGDQYTIENGNMIGPTKQGVEELISLDPDAEWDGDAVTNSDFQPWEASPRVVHMPLYDPRFPIDPGKQPIEVSNIVSFFIMDMQGNNVMGRFLGASGVGVGGEPAPGSALQFVQLVE